MLKIENPKPPGFDTVVMNERFKCAFITHSPYYAFGEVNHMKRHNKTDEILGRLSGKAVLLILENEEFKEYVLEVGSAYNVKQGTWHYLAVTEDARVFVAESADTDGSNTDVLTLDELYVLGGK